MKKVYVRPTIEIENFEANEYVASCVTVSCTVSGCDFSLRARDISAVTEIHCNTSHNVLGGGKEQRGRYYHVPEAEKKHHLVNVVSGWGSAYRGTPNISQ